MTSIIIPAHNEAQVIERCLTSILADAKPGEFEIVVVCNGCSDNTAECARRVGGSVKVLETPVRSKIFALNLGDKHVTSFPRLYVDADVQLTTSAVRDVAWVLGDDSPIVVAAPRARLAYHDRPLLVRAFYRVWTQLPYFKHDLIGSGVYAFSRRGRERFSEFPDIIADDEYARLTAAPHERRVVKSSTFTIHPPRTLAGVVNINTRARAGNYELRKQFPDLHRHQTTNSWRSLRIIASNPSLWFGAPIYLGVMSIAKRRADTKLRLSRQKNWERDDTSRESRPPLEADGLHRA
jgi:glycosyltransferase involved in cell wall biosynthesis